MKAIKRSAIDQKPSAWIVNPTDRGRKSIKTDNKIYLEDGNNFEIELFNPLNESVLSDIKVNGKSVSSSGLVLRPGERFYLDCFLDDKKKFVFKTYSVEDSDESKSAISNNGIVEVFFYKEETLKINNWREVFTPVIEKHFYYPSYPHYYPYFTYPYYTVNGYANTNITIGSTGTFNITSGVANTLTVNSCTSNAVITNTDGLYSNLMNINSSYVSDVNDISYMETGRVEKGEVSSQDFIDIDMNFEKMHISNVIYQLLPQSTKPIETREIKYFCDSCGKKIKGSENFCSICGNKLK